MTSFYKNLHTSTNPTETNIDSYLDTPHFVKKLTSEHRDLLDSPITEQEILNIIKKIKPNKFPGPDGYPIAYY